MPPLSPQRTVLSQVDCFIQCEVVSSQISLDGVQPRDARAPGGSQEGGALGSSQHLRHHPYMQYAQTQKDAVTGLSL